MKQIIQRKNKNYILTYIFLVSFVFFLINSVPAGSLVKKYDLTYPEELIKLAASLSMEPIEGERFLYNLRIYAGQGLPYAFNVLTKPTSGKKEIPASVLFWCHQEEKRYLVYAVDDQKDKKHCNYEVKKIITMLEFDGYDHNTERSYGMTVYDGVLGVDKDLSHFSYLDNPKEHGPKGVYPIPANGFLPVIMSQESSIAILYLYKDRWLQYVERDI